MIIENFTPQGGHHCITNSLKQIFEFNNYPVSEPMLFGLGSCLGFVYINLADAPMISGRIKPADAEQNIYDRTGIKIQNKSPKDYPTAYNSIKSLISKEIPVMVYVDMMYLKYLNLFEGSHFGGHSIVVFGFDDNEGCFYVSDRDNNDWSIHTPKSKIAADFHKVPYEEMAKARNSSFRPFPANNKWLNFDFSKARAIDQSAIFDSIAICTNNMLNPPANLLGINGIRKFAKEVKKWKTFDIHKFRLAGITNYFMISADGGTGGGLFRKMYGDFLTESSALIGNKKLADYGNSFIEIARLWDNISFEMMNIFHNGNLSVTDNLNKMITEIADKEENIFFKIRNNIK